MSILHPSLTAARATGSLAILISFAVSSTSCGGGSSTPPPDPTPGASASGVWSITDTIQSANSVCSGEVGFVDTYTVTVVDTPIDDTRSNLTVTTPAGTFSGQRNGTVITWTGSYPEDGGTVTTTFTHTANADLTSFSGTSSWSWSDGFNSCTGTTSTSGTKISTAISSAPTAPAITGIWSVDADGDRSTSPEALSIDGIDGAFDRVELTWIDDIGVHGPFVGRVEYTEDSIRVTAAQDTVDRSLRFALVYQPGSHVLKGTLDETVRDRSGMFVRDSVRAFEGQRQAD